MMGRHERRQAYLARQLKTRLALGAAIRPPSSLATHPAAPLPEETEKDKRQARNARKRQRRRMRAAMKRRK